MRKYLLTLVLKVDADRKAAMAEIKEAISSVEGAIDSEEELANKKLAYEIEKTREGVFLLIRLTGTNELPSRLVEVLRISDYALRFMVTTEVSKLSAEPKQKREKADRKLKV
jgi:small subunit ribosomal protein S6